MNKFFDAFNELPKPRFLRNLPPLETLNQLVPEIPGLLAQLMTNKKGFDTNNTPLNAAKKHSLRLAVMLAETVFNQHIYHQKALKNETAKLHGKSLAITINELGHTLTLVFNQLSVDILVDAEYLADCQLNTSLATLKKLKDKTILTELIKTEQLNVQGDITVLQEVNQLIDKIEPGVGAILSPIVGDLAASVIESILRAIFILCKEKSDRVKSYLIK